MGLDQYAFSEQKPEEPQFIWRKHAKLQEFMEALFEERTGRSADELNCANFELTKPDIETLEDLVKAGKLPSSSGGFFYGHQFQEESAVEYKAQDLEFCQWARVLLETRQKVFYSCWW